MKTKKQSKKSNFMIRKNDAKKTRNYVREIACALK